MPDDTLHEHKCDGCQQIWSCRRTDCTPWDNQCPACEDAERAEWGKATQGEEQNRAKNA